MMAKGKDAKKSEKKKPLKTAKEKKLAKRMKRDGKANQDNVKILYIGAPRYRISVTASDFKSAEKTLKPILEDIQKNIEKNKGDFKFTREESRKTGGE